MSRRPRRNHSATFKAKLHDVHPNQITDWKTQLLERAASVFGAGEAQAEPRADVKELHAKIGQQALEIDFCPACAHQGGTAERKAMIDRNHELPVKRQAELLGISRGSVYYLPKPLSEADLALMRMIDQLHLEHPFAGARMLRDMLKARGFKVAP
jgi:putative transposase